MTDYLFGLIQPEFMQSLTVMTVFFLLPLGRKQSRRIQAVILLAAFLIGGALSAYNNAAHTQAGAELLPNLSLSIREEKSSVLPG